MKAPTLAAVLVVVFAASVLSVSRDSRGSENPAASKKKANEKTHDQVESAAKPLIQLPREKVPIKKWLKKNSWKSARHDPSRFEVGDGRLHLVSKDDSVLIGTKQGFPVSPREWPRLRIRFRVERNPAGMDLSKKSGDDAAFRVYVSFDRGGGIFSPPHTLAYTWTEKVEAGRIIQSEHFKQLRYVSIGRGLTRGAKARVGKENDADRWTTVTRNILEDYRRAFPEDKKEVPSITGIGLKCDSNNTETSAEAWLSALELLPSAN